MAATAEAWRGPCNLLQGSNGGAEIVDIFSEDSYLPVQIVIGGGRPCASFTLRSDGAGLSPLPAPGFPATFFGV